MTSESITVVHSYGRRLAKRINLNGTIAAYDAARTFDLITVPVADMDALAGLLGTLARHPDRAVVMGTVVDENRTRGVRRLVHDKPGEPATLRSAPRVWLPLDMEGITLDSATPAADLRACGERAIGTLPSAFRGVRCVIQASGSHGFKPDLRLRLWFWCSRALEGAEATRWLRGTPADPSVFRPAQLIYTAAPVFAAGVADPLPLRIVELAGDAVLTPPTVAELASAPRPSVPYMPPADHDRRSRYAAGALLNATHRIITASQRHPAIIAECRGLSRLVAAGVLDEGRMRAVIHGASAAAGKSDPAEIDACIAWGLANAALPAGSPR